MNAILDEMELVGAWYLMVHLIGSWTHDAWRSRMDCMGLCACF